MQVNGKMAFGKESEVKMDKCPLCGGAMTEKLVTHPQEYGGRIILLENVPVLSCKQCGEIMIRPEILERIQKLAWSDSEPQRTETVPVYDVAKVI
jgi:YgiT-type zinc finger domain-containing protein